MGPLGRPGQGYPGLAPVTAPPPPPLPLCCSDEELTLFVAAHWSKFKDPDSRQSYWYNQVGVWEGVWGQAGRAPHNAWSRPPPLRHPCLPDRVAPGPLHADVCTPLPPCASLRLRSRTVSAGRSRCCRSASRLTTREGTSSRKRVGGWRGRAGMHEHVHVHVRSSFRAQRMPVPPCAHPPAGACSPAPQRRTA